MTDQSLSPAEASPPPQHVPRRKRRWWRAVARIAVAFALLIGGIAALLMFQPVSADWANDRLRRAVREEAGLDLKFHKAHWMLRSGQLVLEGPQFHDPEAPADAGAPLLALAALEVDLDLGSVIGAVLRREGGVVIERVAAQGPLTIPLIEENGQVRLGARFARLLELIRDARPDEPDRPGRTRLETIEISRVRIELARTGGNQPSVFAGIRDAGLTADFGQSNVPNQIGIRGALVEWDGEGREISGGGSAINVRLMPDRDFAAVDIRLAVEEVDSRRHVAAQLPMDFGSRRIHLDGNAVRNESGEWSASFRGEAPRITLVGAGVHGVDHHFENVRASTALQWRPEDHAVEVDTLHFRSRDLALEADGTIGLQRPLTYALAVERGELRGAAIDLIEQMVFEEKRVAEANQGRVEVRGTLAGKMDAFPPETLDARFIVEDLALDLPKLPEPIRRLRMTGRLTTDTLTLEDSFAFVQGVPVNVTGYMRGVPLRGAIERAELEWKTAGNVRGISELIQEQREGWDIAVEGDVSGQGRLVVTDADFGRWEELQERVEYSGRVLFNEATVRSRRLKQPITNISGKIELNGATAQLTGLKGNMDDVRLSVEGMVTGQERLLRDPRVDLIVEAAFDVARLEDYAQWFDAETPGDLPPVRGSAVARANLTGPVEDWKSFEYTGKLRIEDFWADVNSRFLGGELAVPLLEINVLHDRLELPRTIGRWEGGLLTAEATLGIDEGHANLTMDADASLYPKLLPLTLGRLVDMGGRVAATNVTHVKRRDAASRSYPNLTEFLLDLAERMEAEDFNARDVWEVENGGEAQLTDVRLRYESMPEQALISEAFGRVYYDLERFWTESGAPVSLKPSANSEPARADVAIDYPRGKRTVALRFDVDGSYTHLDDWLRDWNQLSPRERDRPTKPKPPRPPGVPAVDIHVAMNTNRAHFRGIDTQQLSGAFDYTWFEKGHWTMSWTDVNAKTPEGSARVRGLWREESGEQYEEHEFDVTKMRVVDVMRAGLEEVHKESGLSSGLLTGKLSLTRRGGTEQPFNGQGEILVEQSRFISSALFRGLGSLIGLDDFFKDVTFSRIAGAFKVENDVVVIDRASPVVFENPAAIYPLRLDTHGRIGPEKKLNLTMNLQFLPVVSRIPVVGRIWERIVGRIFNFQVEGVVGDPDISMGVPVVGSD